ncbi:MAG: metallopeptidase family protein [Myxococcota bacterium]
MNDKDRYWDCLDLAMEASHGGRTDEALAWLDEALKARPGGAEAHNGRGEILWDEGRAEEALHQFELAMQADANFLTAHLNRAELLIEEMGEFERAISQCDLLLSGDEATPSPDRPTEAEVYYLKSKALFYLENLEGALFLVRRAIKTAGDVAVYRAFEGQILFELGNFEDARRQLEHAVLLDPDSPHAIYHFALALERLGEDRDALRAFQQANAIDADHYPLPVSIDDAAFDAAADQALEDLPRSIREYVENVPVMVRDFPEDDLLEGQRVSPQILGLFIGVPRTQAEPSQQATDVDRVFLFKRNLEKICHTRAQLVEQIQITVKHEIGHYLGLDEDDLERLGLG